MFYKSDTIDELVIIGIITVTMENPNFEWFLSCLFLLQLSVKNGKRLKVERERDNGEKKSRVS